MQFHIIKGMVHLDSTKYVVTQNNHVRDDVGENSWYL